MLVCKGRGVCKTELSVLAKDRHGGRVEKVGPTASLRVLLLNYGRKGIVIFRLGRPQTRHSCKGHS